MIYIIRVIDDGEFLDYEYNNLKHAEEHYNQEKNASLIEYKDGQHFIIKVK